MRYFAADRLIQHGEFEPAKQALEGLLSELKPAEARELVNQRLQQLALLGHPAPAWHVAQWMTENAVESKDLLGKVAVIHFAAMEGPSLAHINGRLAKLAEDNGERLAVVEVLLASQKPSPEELREVFGDGAPFPVALDDEEKTLRAYLGDSDGWTAVVDQRGDLQYLDYFDEEILRERIQTLLKAAA